MSEGHWIVNKVIAGHAMAFNMDTLVTMWVAMAFLIVVAFIKTTSLFKFFMPTFLCNDKLFKRQKDLSHTLG